MATTNTTDQPPRVRGSLPDPAVWDDPPMRQALAVQDITTTYRLLIQLGFSQQRIAALIGQGQPGVCVLTCGRRVVIGYRVLSRVAVGWGVPGGCWGLSWCAGRGRRRVAAGGLGAGW